MDLAGFNPTGEDTSQLLRPYMREYFRRDPRFQERLAIYFWTSIHFSTLATVRCTRATASMGVQPAVSITVVLPSPDMLEQLFPNLITLIPQWHVVSFTSSPRTQPPEELLRTMLNIETLHLSGIELSKGFLQPNPDSPQADAKLLPSLRSLYLEDFILSENNWGHLTT